MGTKESPHATVGIAMLISIYANIHTKTKYIMELKIYFSVFRVKKVDMYAYLVAFIYTHTYMHARTYINIFIYTAVFMVSRASIHTRIFIRIVINISSIIATPTNLMTTITMYFFAGI